MIVAVVAVGMVQVTIDQVIRMVAVRHRLVSAGGAVLVAFLVRSAVVLRRTLGRVVGVDRKSVFLHAAAGDMVQMTVVKEIDVVTVPNGGVPAAGSVLVIVIGMFRVIGHVCDPHSNHESRLLYRHVADAGCMYGLHILIAAASGPTLTSFPGAGSDE